MNYFWANQNDRFPNNRSNRSFEVNNYQLPGGHLITPQDMLMRGLIRSIPPVSGPANPYRSQIHPNFTQGSYLYPNIVEALTTQPSRVPFPSFTTNNNTTYGGVLPIDFSSGSSPFQPNNIMTSLDNNVAFNSLASYGNLLNLDVVGNSFNGGIRSVPNRFSNLSRPNFGTNSFLYSSEPHFPTNDFSCFSNSNFLNNQMNPFSYGENSNNSSLINNFTNNTCTRLNMNNFYNPRNFLSANNNNFMVNLSTSVNRNNRGFGLENVVMPLPTPIQVNDSERVRSPSTNAVDLARERALKRHSTSIDVGQEAKCSKRLRVNNEYSEGQQSLFKDKDDGEKNSSTTSENATDDGGNGNDDSGNATNDDGGNGNDEEN